MTIISRMVIAQKVFTKESTEAHQNSIMLDKHLGVILQTRITSYKFVMAVNHSVLITKVIPTVISFKVSMLDQILEIRIGLFV